MGGWSVARSEGPSPSRRVCRPVRGSIARSDGLSCLLTQPPSDDLNKVRYGVANLPVVKAGVIPVPTLRPVAIVLGAAPSSPLSVELVVDGAVSELKFNPTRKGQNKVKI